MNLVSLSLKCPICGESVMDKDQLVDNSPGIKLNIKTKGNSGTIWLSSVYESYNYYCNINIAENEIVEFSCPHCNENIKSNAECKTCGAGMAHLHMDMGGRVSFCLRNGCKDHFLEFDKISLALQKIHQEYPYDGKYGKFSQGNVKKENIQGKEKTDDTKEIIESGTYLSSYCPHCKKSLIEDGMLKLQVKTDKTGYVMLSPYLNVFTTKSTIFLKEKTEVADLSCFRCGKSLKVEGKKCGDCGSPVAKIMVSAQTKLIDFYMCSKKGCRWHGLNDEDLYDIRLEDSLEW